MKHFVFAGRYGDICHSLPAVWEYFQRTGLRPRFTAAKEFAGILDGCSYLEPVAAPVPWVNINDVIAYSRSIYPEDDFTVMACYGKDYSPGYQCHSYLRQSWSLSQCPQPPESQPLVFDKRDAAREEELHVRLNIQPGRYILVSTAGKSSPFPHPQMLVADIKTARPDCQVIDISTTKAARVYDLIGLFERAEALVTIDTMHLHLAAACPRLPVFAFICNGPTRWNRTDWRPQQWWRCLYAEYPDRRAQFRTALDTAIPSTPKIHHVWTHGGTRDADCLRRMTIAHESWHLEADWARNWTIAEITESNLTRTMETDGNLPYIHDIIATTIERRAPADTDIISFANADIGCIRGITGYVLDAVREHGCAFAHRWDVDGRRLEVPIASEHDVGGLRWYPGSDWFWMTPKWWREHQAEMPDMVIGREYWDCILRQLMKKHGAREIHKSIWHEKHPSYWDRPGNRQALPGNQYNRALANQFFAENRSNDLDPYRTTWNVQPNTTRIDPTSDNRQSTRTTGNPHNIVLPVRLEFHRHQPRRIVRQ